MPRSVAFLRDLAKLVLEADRHAKVQMRKKVSGLSTIEHAVLTCKNAETLKPHEEEEAQPEATPLVKPESPDTDVTEVDTPEAVVLADTVAVRRTLNHDQGGPLHPPGLRMAEGLGEVRESLQRDLDAKKGGSRRRN